MYNHFGVNEKLDTLNCLEDKVEIPQLPKSVPVKWKNDVTAIWVQPPDCTSANTALMPAQH